MSPPPGTLFDPGLQPERTALAWRRTGAALAVGSLVGMRILPHSLGPAGLAGSIAALLLSGYVLLWAHRRYRRISRALVSAPDAGPRTDGRGILALAAATTVLALATTLTVLAG